MHLRTGDDADLPAVGALHYRSRVAAYAHILSPEALTGRSAEAFSEWWAERWRWGNCGIPDRYRWAGTRDQMLRGNLWSRAPANRPARTGLRLAGGAEPAEACRSLFRFQGGLWVRDAGALAGRAGITAGRRRP